MELDNAEKRSRLFRPGSQIRNHRKSPGLDFFGDFVLTEGLGGGAGQ
ncbi:hypothetical protein [Metabacillus idriensis]|nr:hypothetical protein [Metabacillus idriensis]